MKLLLLYIIITLLNITGSIVHNNHRDNRCNLNPKLVDDIASYKHFIRRIMNEIIHNRYGQEMYIRYMDFIDQFGPRLSGTENLEKAIDHMINLTYIYGLHDVTTEQEVVPLWKRGHESAKMIEPLPKNMKILGLGSSVGTPPGGITAEAIVINSFDELENTDKEKIEGKIVVYDAHYITHGQTVIYRSEGASRAAKKGAVATLVRSITPFSIYSPHTGAQQYATNVTKIPTAAITLEDADLMRRIQNRNEKIVIHLEMDNTSLMKKSRNTIIDLKGSKHPEKHVIVSGHIDSWDVGTGAMDDGGGMMISWFVPVILKKLGFRPRRTVRAIIRTAEEPGLVGAQAYLTKHLNELDNIQFIMESDEGTFKPLGLDVAGSNTTRCIIAEILKQFAPIDKMTNSGHPGSDITLFVAKGVPGASLLNENERYFWYHHSEGDVINVQNPSNVIECAAFWAALSYVIADLSVDLPR